MQFVESFEVSFRDYLQLEIGLLIVYEPIYLTLCNAWCANKVDLEATYKIDHDWRIQDLELVYSDLDNGFSQI
ncbi:hypothetical protein MTR67_047065 [Solanum verrucosum]|uniref:Uncharacterized protein n=1 Tax=Solanum verrucosum TaxID=315347 RepID=A0AAF0UVS6_SOLVR|nr:hypothetical protein MTR67_047065 [Solanum verrucosum]